MKIVIADYPDVLGRELEKEYTFLREVIPDAAIVTHPYTDPEAFYREMQDADGLLTAFIPLDKTALDHMVSSRRFPLTQPAITSSIWRRPADATSRYAQSENTAHRRSLTILWRSCLRWTAGLNPTSVPLTVSTAGSIIWPPNRWG